MQARIVALRHGANLQRSALHFVPLFRPSIIPSVRYVHIPRSNIGRLKEEIFDTDSPVKPSAPEIPLPSKPAEKSLLKQVSHLLKYLDSSVPISMRINRLRAFTLSLDPSQIHPSKPLVPLLLLRTLTFECTTLDDLSSMTRSVRVLQLQKAAINELCMAIINQCRDLARDNIGLASDSVKDMNMILSTMSIMGVETDEFPAELKSYMASAFKDIFKFPEQMGSFTDLSVALQAALRLSMDFTVVDEFEQSVMNCIAYQLQTGKSATSKDLIAIITSITKSPRFMDPNSIIATDSSTRATMVALINAAFNAMAINATQSPMLGADFNLALNAVRSTIFRDNINDALRVSIGKAISNALPLVEDRNLPNIVRHLVDLKMRRGHISPEASGALVSEIEKRMTRIPLQSFAQILRGIYSLELESAIRQRRTFVAAVDSALPEMLSVFTGSSPSANTPSSSQQMSIQAWPQQSQESFVSMIHSFGKLPIKWADLSAPAKDSLLQSWSRLLPVVDQSGALTMIAAMSKMRVHYPNLLPHGLDATLVQLFQKMLDQRCSTYQLSAIWLSLGGMNAAWSHISEEMKTILTTCAHKMPMEEASVGVARIAPDSLYGMGLMGMKWREMPLNTQRYLTRLLSQYWKLITATTTNEATSRSMEQLLPTLIAGMGMMEMPVAYLDTIPRIPSTAAVTINWEKILQNSHLWHGARVALLWNSVSHVDDATWSTIPVNLMECLVRPLETSIQSLDNRALTILMAATVRLAIDLPWEVSTRKARKVHRNVELNRVCNALLLELVRRDAAMKAQHINGTSNKAAASTSTWNQVMLMQIRSFLLMMKQRVHEMSTSDPKSTASSPLIATWNTHRESWAPSFFSPETVIGSAKATKHIQSVDDLQTMAQGDSDRVQFHTVSKYHQTMSEMLRAALSKVDTSADSSHDRRRSRSQHQQHRDSDRFAVINEYFGLRWSVEDENTAVPDFAVDVAVFSSEQRQRPLAFVEINGPHHYIPVHTVQSASSSTKKQEGMPPPAMKLRREDVVKEHFYRSVYPDIPLLRISANDARPRHQIIDEMVEKILQREATMLEQLPHNEHPNATIKPAVAVPSPYKGDGKDVRKPKVVTAVEEIDDDKESKDSEKSNVSKSPEVKDEVASEIDDFMTLVKPRVVDSQEKKKEKEFVTFIDNDEEDDEEDDDEDEDGEDEEFDEDEDEADDEAGIEELENDFIDEDEEEAELDDEAMFARMVLEAEEEDRRHRQLGSSSVDDDEDSTTERRSVSKGRQQKQFSDSRFSRREIPEKAAKQSGRGRYKKNDESAGEDRKFGKVGKIEVDDADADDSDDSDLPPPKYRLNI